MRNRSLLNLEYSNLDEADKIIGISKQLNVYDAVQNMVYLSIDRHAILKQQMGVEIIPIISLNEFSFMFNIIKVKEFDDIKMYHEYMVNSFDLLKRFSH